MTMPTKKIAVLLMSFGTPYNESDLSAYYTHIRHGHAPSAQLTEDLKARYQAIGGLSPLAKITQDLVAGVTEALTQRHPGVKVYLGLRHIHPFIEDVMAQIVSDGYTEIYGLPLAAHYSTFTAKDYHQTAEDAISMLPGVHYHALNGFWQDLGLMTFWANQLRNQVKLHQSQKTRVIFSAHSLPLKTVEAGDHYRDEVSENAAQIAQIAKVQSNDYLIGWQSAGRTKDPWIGPDFLELAADLVKNQSVQTILSAPIGFINNNLEINYDVDIELRETIEAAGGTLIRLDMPNAAPQLTTAIARKIESAL